MDQFLVTFVVFTVILGPRVIAGDAPHILSFFDLQAWEPRHPSSAVGPAEGHTHLTRIGSRPAIAGCLAADAVHSACLVTHGVSNRVRSATAPAFARAGCSEPLVIDGQASSLAAPAKETKQPGLESNRIPGLPLRPALSSERAAYLQKRDLRGRLALKPAP